MVVAITLDGRGQLLFRVLHSKRLGELFIQFADITTNGRGPVGEIRQAVQLINAILSHLAGNNCSESGTAPSGLSTSLLMLLMTTVYWRLVASRATAVVPSCPGRAIRRIRQRSRILCMILGTSWGLVVSTRILSAMSSMSRLPIARGSSCPLWSPSGA
jgi:hypothetical protein